MYKSIAITLLICLVGLFALVQDASAQTTSFTYQGSLKDGANAANGNYDFEFALFDALSGGTQLGTTQTQIGVVVANGIFAVNLDFGSQFPGANRFLEIRVRPAGQPGITILSPRQLVNSAPYSVKSLGADSAANATNATTANNALQLGGVAANQYVVTTDPRMTDARTPTAGSANYVQNGTSAQATSNFNISGNGTAGGTLTGGTVNAVNPMTGYQIGGSRVLSNAGTENLFAGVGAGQANTTGVANSFVGASAGFSNMGGSFNSFFGNDAGSSNMAGHNNSFFGRLAGSSNTAGSDNSFFGRSAGISNTIGTNNTMIGRGANVAFNNLSFATAIGADAVVSTSNTIALGRQFGFDTVYVQGFLKINNLGAASTNTNLCFGNTSLVSFCTSSIRYKSNVLPLKLGLDTVGRLRPVTFDWKESNQTDLGLIAEEVEAIDPLLVTYNKENQIQGVKYDQLTVVLINAVKEQQEQIESQEKRIGKQEEVMRNQQAEIDELRLIVCSLKPDARGCSTK